MRILIFCSLALLVLSAKGMHQSAKMVRQRTSQKLSSQEQKERIISWLIHKKRWKKTTCEFMKANPNHEDAQILARYLDEFYKHVLNIANGKKSLMPIARQCLIAGFPDTYPTLDFIIKGEKTQGVPFFAMVPGDLKWKPHLAEIETRIEEHTNKIAQ